MSLFVRRPETEGRISFTTYGMNKTLLIVGLGNPGKEYDLTRHNIGFLCVDEFAAKNKFEPWVNKKDIQCQLTQATMGDGRVILCKPQSFMNLSGEAVQAVANYFKIPVESIIVVHDELDITFGQIRTRVGGGNAGHNGVKSLAQHLGEGFSRVRIGIGPKTPEQIDSADFVLQKFSEKEQADLNKLSREISSMLSEYAYGTPFNVETRSFL